MTKVRLFLFEFGFGYAWEYQGVGNEKLFIKNLRQRLIDIKWQDWHSHIQSSERFKMYRNFSATHVIKRYLSINMDRYLRSAFVKFRFGVSVINVHTCRYKKVTNAELLCPLCKKSIEDEIHLLLTCPVLYDLRKKLIPRKFYANPCLFRFSLLMASEHEKTVRGVALFLHKAFVLREAMLS